MSEAGSVLRVDRSPPGNVVRVTLARPAVRNAFNAELIAALREAFEAFAGEAAESQRAVVLAGEGSVFCAGADI
jgi:methylglutaconyl-CoA hydratase